MSKKKIILYILLLGVVIVVGWFFYVIYSANKPFVPKYINEFPMYGRDSYDQHIRERSEEHKIADESFIETILNSGDYQTAREASTGLCYISNEYFNSGDYSTAMKRTNQAWLLDHTNPCIYANFGYHYMFAEMNLEKSFEMYEKALTLATEDEDRWWILVDYSEVATICYSKDKTRIDCLDLAWESINESIEIMDTPKTNRVLALLYYYTGEFEKSWEHLHLAIDGGIDKEVFGSFIWLLKFEMKDPKGIL